LRDALGRCKLLDELDREILRLLQEPGFCGPKVTEIAKRLRATPATISRRLQRLEGEGVVREFVAHLDPRKAGRGFTAFVMGQAKLGEGVDMDRAGSNLASIPEVLEVHFITGEYDYLVKLRVRDQDEYYRVVQRVAAQFGGRGQGLVSPKTFKETTKLVLE